MVLIWTTRKLLNTHTYTQATRIVLNDVIERTINKANVDSIHWSSELQT